MNFTSAAVCWTFERSTAVDRRDDARVDSPGAPGWTIGGRDPTWRCGTTRRRRPRRRMTIRVSEWMFKICKGYTPAAQLSTANRRHQGLRQSLRQNTKLRAAASDHHQRQHRDREFADHADHQRAPALRRQLAHVRRRPTPANVNRNAQRERFARSVVCLVRERAERRRRRDHQEAEHELRKLLPEERALVARSARAWSRRTQYSA